MTDNKLSTRDLANRSDTEDSSLDTEQPARERRTRRGASVRERPVG